MSDDLTKLRIELDKLDDQLLEILIQRFRLVKYVAAGKMDWNDKFDPEREKAMLERWLKKTEKSLDSTFIEKLLQLITDESKRLQ